MALGHLSEIVVDCRQPAILAAFWQQMIGGELADRDDDWCALVPTRGLILAFQRVPETKAGKNRLHLDVQVDEVHAAVAAAERLGATRVGEMRADPLGTFHVMLDPEGNEFCFVVDP
jgi:predicted enzyme related to lactoylglutathione lyase